jgi:TP901 family phage tail tape measure protein
MVGETVAGKLVVEIVGDASGLIKAYDDAKKRTEGLEGDLKSIGSRMTSIGSDLMLKVTAPLALTGGLMVKTAADFDDSMRKVAAVTGATGDQFDRLRQQATDLGASTAWSASESAAAMQYLGMAGLDTNEILEATPQMLSLASAGAMELASAADIATNVLSGFNLEVSDLAHVSDVLAQAAASSNTSVEQLGHAMAYVGPVASSAGLSIEETTAAIQVMSNSGIQGTMAGTALRGALTSLLSPTKQATDILATYGLTAEDVNPEVHSLAEILDTLSSAGLSTADAMSLFGDRAGPGMIALLRAGGDGIRDYTAALEDCDGAAQRMAETMEGGVGGSLRELEGAIETLSITFGDLIADALMPAIEGATSLANWLSNLDEGTQRVIVTTGLLAAATGPVIWGLGTLAGSVGQLISLYRTYQASTIAATIATRGFSAAIAANPIGLAIIGVTTLGAVLLPLIASTRDATDATQEYGESLKDIQDLTEKTTETIEDEIDALREMEQELRNQISVIRSQYTPVTERQTAATRRATQETNWQKLATGELVGEFRDATEAAQRQTNAIDGLTQSQKDAIIAAKELEIAEIEKARVIRETELATRRLADGAKIAYDQASKAVSGHQRAVSDLQKEYDELKATIDRALGIDKEIETAERDVERAEIRTIRARQTLADLEKEIKEKELEIRTATFEDADDRARAERDLADLKLRHREAVLDVADAEDRYQDALIESQTVKEEKTEIEKELNGESISSAQNRLDEIGKLLEEEQKKLDVALRAREEAQIAHENLMAQIENEGLDVKSANWKEYVEYVNNNPAIARTYHVEYDADGNPKGGLPQIPTVNIQVPSYASPAFAQTTTAATTNGSALDAGATSATSGTGINIPTAATVGGGGVSVTLNQNIYTQTQTAGEVQAATERGLRDAALQGVL